MQRAALLARTFRQSSGAGRWPCGIRETRIFETNTTATSIRDVEMYDSLFPLSSRVSLLPFSPRAPRCSSPSSLSPPLTCSLSLMNSIAINSIKTSVVLGGFHPHVSHERREGGKDRGQEVAENPVNSRHGSIDECTVLLKGSRLWSVLSVI